MRPTKWYPYYQYSFGKIGRKAVKFFKVIIEKTFFDHQHTKMCRIKFFTAFKINVISSELYNRR